MKKSKCWYGGRMKNRLQTLALVLSFMSLSASVGLVFALSDIYHDYISAKQLGSLTTQHINLPDFTACSGEWLMVFLAVTLVIISLASHIFFLSKKFNRAV
jgi:hypothetical protein